MPMPRNQQEYDQVVSDMMQTMERWVREGRLRPDDLDDINSPATQAKVQRLIIEDMERGATHMYRAERAEQIGLKYGRWVIGGVIALIFLIITNGC